MGVKPGDSPQKDEGWRRKAMNEEQKQPTLQKPLEGSPKQVPSLGKLKNI